MERLLTVIVNHNHNAQSIQLKNRLREHFNPLLLDSGSKLKSNEKSYFDHIFSNVYYNGLINESFKLLKSKHSHLFLITSDVIIENPKNLYERIEIAISNPKVGVYAPSVSNTTHSHMRNLGTGRIRKVTFTDGFCLVIPKEFLSKICPIDLKVNKIGHGTDIYLGYLSMIRKTYAVVDDAISIEHPIGSGYDPKEARKQRDTWFETKPQGARIFNRIVSRGFFKSKLGFVLVNFLMSFFRKKE